MPWRPWACLYLKQTPKYSASETLFSSSCTVTTAGSPTSTTVVPTGGREFLSLFPPFFMRTTTFEEFRDGLYVLTQPLALGSSGFDVKLRMTVARLGDGSLLVGCRPQAAGCTAYMKASCVLLLPTTETVAYWNSSQFLAFF